MLETIGIIIAVLLTILLHIISVSWDSDEYGWWSFSATLISIGLLAFTISYASYSDKYLTLREKSIIKTVSFENNTFFETEILGNKILSTGQGHSVQEVFGRDTTLVFDYHEMDQSEIGNYYIYVFDTKSILGIKKPYVRIVVSSKPYEKYELVHYFNEVTNATVIEEKK
jgi:hypothetical protein